MKPARALPPSARRRKVESAREHLLRAAWALMDVADALDVRRRAGGLTAGERAELARLVDALNLASRSRTRLEEIDEPAPAELPGQARIGE